MESLKTKRWYWCTNANTEIFIKRVGVMPEMMREMRWDGPHPTQATALADCVFDLSEGALRAVAPVNLTPLIGLITEFFQDLGRPPEDEVEDLLNRVRKELVALDRHQRYATEKALGIYDESQDLSIPF